jgi:hypothetical protein
LLVEQSKLASLYSSMYFPNLSLLFFPFDNICCCDTFPSSSKAQQGASAASPSTAPPAKRPPFPPLPARKRRFASDASNNDSFGGAIHAHRRFEEARYDGGLAVVSFLAVFFRRFSPFFPSSKLSRALRSRSPSSPFSGALSDLTRRTVAARPAKHS